MNWTLIIPLVCLTITSCIEPIDVPPPSSQPGRLSVEGYLTTQPGPHIITLTRTAPYGSVFFSTVNSEVGASVAIREDNGMLVELTEVSPGKYQTPRCTLLRLENLILC